MVDMDTYQLNKLTPLPIRLPLLSLDFDSNKRQKMFQNKIPNFCVKARACNIDESDSIVSRESILCGRCAWMFDKSKILFYLMFQQHHGNIISTVFVNLMDLFSASIPCNITFMVKGFIFENTVWKHS